MLGYTLAISFLLAVAAGSASCEGISKMDLEYFSNLNDYMISLNSEDLELLAKKSLIWLNKSPEFVKGGYLQSKIVDAFANDFVDIHEPFCTERVLNVATVYQKLPEDLSRLRKVIKYLFDKLGPVCQADFLRVVSSRLANNRNLLDCLTDADNECQKFAPKTTDLYKCLAKRQPLTRQEYAKAMYQYLKKNNSGVGQISTFFSNKYIYRETLIARAKDALNSYIPNQDIDNKLEAVVGWISVSNKLFEAPEAFWMKLALFKHGLAINKMGGVKGLSADVVEAYYDDE